MFENSINVRLIDQDRGYFDLFGYVSEHPDAIREAVVAECVGRGGRQVTF